MDIEIYILYTSLYIYIYIYELIGKVYLEIHISVIGVIYHWMVPNELNVLL